jgi:hypothetical protein
MKHDVLAYLFFAIVMTIIACALTYEIQGNVRFL